MAPSRQIFVIGVTWLTKTNPGGDKWRWLSSSPACALSGRPVVRRAGPEWGGRHWLEWSLQSVLRWEGGWRWDLARSHTSVSDSLELKQVMEVGAVMEVLEVLEVVGCLLPCKVCCSVVVSYDVVFTWDWLVVIGACDQQVRWLLWSNSAQHPTRHNNYWKWSRNPQPVNSGHTSYHTVLTGPPSLCQSDESQNCK